MCFSFLVESMHSYSMIISCISSKCGLCLILSLHHLFLFWFACSCSAHIFTQNPIRPFCTCGMWFSSYWLLIMVAFTNGLNIKQSLVSTIDSLVIIIIIIVAAININIDINIDIGCTAAILFSFETLIAHPRENDKIMFPMFINKSSFNSIKCEILQSRAVLILAQYVVVQKFVWCGVYLLPLPLAMRLFDLNRHSINRMEWGSARLGRTNDSKNVGSCAVVYWNEIVLGT